jgi:hypothetical protein
MTQVNDFTARCLDNATHDINGSIVTIKKRSSRYDANFMLWDIRFSLFHRVID